MNTYKSKLNDGKVESWTIICFLLILAFILPELIDIPTSCPIKLIFGIPCPSCNITHACLDILFHWDFMAAWNHNPIVFLLPIVLVILLTVNISFRFKKTLSVISFILIITILISYVTRMALYFPDDPMSYYWDSLLGRIIKLLS